MSPEPACKNELGERQWVNIRRPLVGAVVWVPRVGMLIMAVVLGVSSMLSGLNSLLLLFAAAVPAWAVFEAIVYFYRKCRLFVFQNGTHANAVIVRKMVTPRGSLYKLNVRIDDEERSHATHLYVSGRDFYEIPLGSTVRVCFMPTGRLAWMPAILLA